MRFPGPVFLWLVALLALGCPTGGDDDAADDDSSPADDDTGDDDTGDDDTGDDDTGDDDTASVDADGDGFSVADGDCNDDNAAVYPGAPHTCDGILDNDCDGFIDEEETDTDGDGFTDCDGDCDDLEADAHPGGLEVIDGIDNDCDGQVDEDDCGNIPPGPFSYNVMSNYKTAEDFALDDQGYIYGFDTGNIFQTDYAGSFTLFSAGASTSTAGFRALPSGDLVFSDVGSGTLVLVDHLTGLRTPVLSGLSYGNGIEVDDQGWVYVAEQSAGQIRRIDPYSGTNSVLVSGLNNPNGVSFSPDYSILYIGSFGGGTIWAQEVDPQGNPGALSVLRSNVGTGALDGMGVDVCGNVYVADYGVTEVLRITPDGQTVELVADLSPVSSWIPNMQWGSGVGGWDELTLYVIDIGTKIYEIPIGVPSKPRPYP